MIFIHHCKDIFWRVSPNAFGYLFVSAAAWVAAGCVVGSVCYNDADCPGDRICQTDQGRRSGTCRASCKEDGECPAGNLCDPVSHRCGAADCATATDCGEGFTCAGGRCVAEKPLRCKEGMAPIDREFCIDIYEASRPDATAEDSGEADAMALSRPGVIPWFVQDNAEAARACAAAGKSLCTEYQWHKSCTGPAETVYSYGDEYDPAECNGIDTFCRCAEGEACSARSPCPFPYCYQECGADFHVTATGAFEKCTNGYGLFDMNGNLWEHVQGGDDTRVRGGAFNCKDSAQLHRCDYIPGNWTPSALGFRCCDRGRIEGEGDAGVDSGAV